MYFCAVVLVLSANDLSTNDNNNKLYCVKKQSTKKVEAEK
jgi:hypothetical protein